jgi:hypothetical protein
LRQGSCLQPTGFPFAPAFRKNLEGERKARQGDSRRFPQEDLRLHPLPAFRKSYPRRLTPTRYAVKNPQQAEKPGVLKTPGFFHLPG